MEADRTSRMWVALLRGVNVGGASAVPMAKLRALARGLGWAEVQSYVASGNLVFRAAGEGVALAAALRAAMLRGMGVDVPVLVLSGAEPAAVRADCPFRPAEGRHVHGFFPWGEPALDAELLAGLIAPKETLEVRGRVVWLHAPEGIGRSKLAGKMGRVLGGAAFTARNLNTIERLVAMTSQPGC